MVKVVRMGLVGCGRIGRVHLEAAIAVEEVELVGVVDPALGEVPCHPEQPLLQLDELLAEERGVEAVVVAAPTAEHGTIVARSLGDGKHVLCEKPLTLHPAVDLELARLAAERKRVLQVGFWRRFAVPYHALRALLAGNGLGAPKAMRAAQWDAVPPHPTFCDPDVSGGLEVDCGVHEFDLARWLLGCEVERVAAWAPPPSLALGDVGDVDTVHGLARLSNGCALAVDLTRTAGYRDSIRTEVICENGSAVLEFAHDEGSLVVRSGEQRSETIFDGGDIVARSVRMQLRAFAEAVRSGVAHPDASLAGDSGRALAAATSLRTARSSGAWQQVAGPAS